MHSPLLLALLGTRLPVLYQWHSQVVLEVLKHSPVAMWLVITSCTGLNSSANLAQYRIGVTMDHVLPRTHSNSYVYMHYMGVVLTNCRAKLIY